MKVLPLTADRWNDFAELFGPRGACAGCWCMFWRLKRADWERRKGPANRRAMKRIVDRGDVPGLLAYDGGEAIGWCAVAPREAYPALARSRILKPVDEQAVWSVSCLFVRRDRRNTGVSTRLLREAALHVKRLGGAIVEGYPVEPKHERMPDAFAWNGLASSFKSAGYKEVARRSPTRPIMRKALAPARRRR